MSYFDGVQDGDTIFLFTKPCTVTEVPETGNLFRVRLCEDPHDIISVRYDGSVWGGVGDVVGQVMFWQSTPLPFPPPKPPALLTESVTYYADEKTIRNLLAGSPGSIVNFRKSGDPEDYKVIITIHEFPETFYHK